MKQRRERILYAIVWFLVGVLVTISIGQTIGFPTYYPIKSSSGKIYKIVVEDPGIIGTDTTGIIQ